MEMLFQLDRWWPYSHDSHLSVSGIIFADNSGLQGDEMPVNLAIRRCEQAGIRASGHAVRTLADRPP